MSQVPWLHEHSAPAAGSQISRSLQRRKWNVSNHYRL